MDAVVFETVIRSAVARDFDARVGTKRHGNQFIHDGNLRVTLIAADDGVRQAEHRECPTLTLEILCLNGSE